MLDELKMRYKELSFGKRIALCLALGCLPGLFAYYSESSEVEEQYAEAETQEKAAADKLLAAENQLKNLQKTQSELEFTKDQLKKAEARLPDQVVIDEVLRTIGKVSRDMGVNVVLFEPKPEVVKGEEYKFSEMPIRITISSHDYGQICEWVDKVAGGKSKIYLKSWKLARGSRKVTRDVVVDLKSPDKADKAAQEARDNMTIVMEGEFSLYKMATAEQIAAAEAKEMEKSQPASKRGPKPPVISPDEDTKGGAG